MSAGAAVDTSPGMHLFTHLASLAGYYSTFSNAHQVRNLDYQAVLSHDIQLPRHPITYVITTAPLTTSFARTPDIRDAELQIENNPLEYLKLHNYTRKWEKNPRSKLTQALDNCIVFA